LTAETVDPASGEVMRTPVEVRSIDRTAKSFEATSRFAESAGRSHGELTIQVARTAYRSD
jgi:hypothetical protein